MRPLRSLRPTAALALVALAGALSAASADDLTVWTAPALTKVFADDPPGSSQAIRLQACRAEVEWGQIVFRSPEPVTLRLSVSDLVSASGRVIPAAQVSLHPAVYVHVTHLSGNGQRQRYWPEVLPVGDTVTLAPNRNQPVYIGVRVPEDAAPGLYQAVIRAVSPHLTLTPSRLSLRVWPLTIPRTPTTRTSYYVWWDGIATRFGLTEGPNTGSRTAGIRPPGRGPDGGNTAAAIRPLQRQRVFDRFFAFMLDHRLCPMSLPVDIKQADRYMRDPRVNGVRLPYVGTDQELSDTIAFIKRKGWLDRCFYYLLDEPARRQWPEVWATANRLTGLDPLTPRLDTIQPEPDLQGAVSIWCPNVESVYLYDDRIATLTGVGIPNTPGVGAITHPDRSGSVTPPTGAPTEVWWYTCVFPKYPYLTFLLDDDAIAPRLLFWSQPRHGLTGSLYINTIHWGPEGNDPWVEAAGSPVLLNNNDGLLMYTGRGTTVADAYPVTGVRLEMIRDGLEDVELCNMLEREIARLAGPAVAREHLAALASQVLPDLRHPDRDPRHLLALRERVVDEILTLQRDPAALKELLKLPWRVGPDASNGPGRSRMSRPTVVAEDKFAVALRGTPVVDGKLDDVCWEASLAANAPGTRTVITRFRNLTGRIWPSQETAVTCLHDDDNLYVAFRCGEPDVARLTPLSEQPDLAKVDRVAVGLMIGGQERWFVVTMEGVQLEGSLPQPTRVRGGRWEARVRLEPDGYTVEMRLPLTAGRLEAGAPTAPVAFNLFRFAAPGQETLYFTGRHSAKRSPFEFGTLELR